MEQTRISHYAVGDRLGRGGMGEVYEAVDLDLGRSVALKFVAPELAADAEALEGLEREARAAAALQHAHIAILYAFERDGGRSFVAVERMTGGSVRERLVAGRLPVGQALAIARDTAAALAHAHRHGIAHQGVKPENLMFSDGGIVKLMDLGLARATQAALATTAYLPPESTRGVTGPPGDIFALGVTLHEMLAGELPPIGDTPLARPDTSANEVPRALRAARPDAPEEVEALIQRMLGQDPAHRPDAVAVARELAAMTGVVAPLGVDAGGGGLTFAGASAGSHEDTIHGSGQTLPPWVRWALVGMMPVAALIALAALLVPGAVFESRTDRHTTAEALTERGLALLRSDDAREAIPAFDRALELDPSLASALGLRAEARARLNDARGARADWQAYLGMVHDDAERAELEARLRAMRVIAN